MSGQFDGPLYFKSIAHVDTRETVIDSMTTLVTLNLLMAEVGSDIIQFNYSLSEWEQDLQAQGEQFGATDELLALFHGNCVGDNLEFQCRIKIKQDEYNEGSQTKSIYGVCAEQTQQRSEKWCLKAPTKTFELDKKQCPASEDLASTKKQHTSKDDDEKENQTLIKPKVYIQN